MSRLGSGTTASALSVLILCAPATRARASYVPHSSIVVDADTGQVLSADAPDQLHYPASLTKMMTLYMLFEALRDHRVTLDQPMVISAHAASMEPTKLGLRPGSYITVEQAILSLVTLSANDAASALGELLGGDEERFAQMMTLRAHALGMSHSVFQNASGLPDPDQISTARDIALLAKHLIKDFPTEYHYFSTPNFVFRGRTIMNHDHLLQRYPGADGLKTGYTILAGHNLATSAVRDDKRLIGIVLGSPSNGQRDLEMAQLLDQGFAQEGVAVADNRPTPAWHPSLMAVAHAETIPVRRSRRLLPSIRTIAARALAHGRFHTVISDSDRSHGDHAVEVAEMGSKSGHPLHSAHHRHHHH